jgi:hypothetical protein
MKGIASTGAPKTLLGGWVDGWMDGWVAGKAGLRIAYSNQKSSFMKQNELARTTAKTISFKLKIMFFVIFIPFLFM